MGAAIRGPSGLVDLGTEPLTIGRSRANRLVLTHSQVSSRHAEIQPLPGGRYQVVDVGSTNGTSVNGVKLSVGIPQPLNAGDTILLGGSGGVELRFELTADAPWQAGQPQAPASPVGAPFGAPGGFGAGDPVAPAPPAQPFAGGIGQPPGAGFPPAPGGFAPPGQPGPGAQPFAAPQEPFPAQPGGFAPPHQFAPPGGQPAAGPVFPSPGGTADFAVPGGAPPAFPPPGQGPGFPPPGGAPPGGFAPPGGQAPFGAPGGQAAPGFPPPGGMTPAKKRTGRNIFLLSGAILVLVLIVVGVVFGVRTVLSKNNSTSPTPTPPPSTPTPDTTGQVWDAPTSWVSSLRPAAVESSAGQAAHYRVMILVGDAVAVAQVSRVED